MTDAQTRYTTTERELLAIVETLKEFCKILLGQKIRIYTDHKNLIYANQNTECVMRWRLIIEEYSPELIYLKGESNVAADALSCLPIETNDIDLETLMYDNAILFGDTKDEYVSNPVNLELIQRKQQEDKELISMQMKNKDKFLIKNFCGGGNKRLLLICSSNGKIVVPKALQSQIVQWYHTYLCHPGLNRTEETIQQNFIWKNLRQTVQDVCRKCPTCQLTKCSSKNYRHLPPNKQKQYHGKSCRY